MSCHYHHNMLDQIESIKVTVAPPPIFTKSVPNAAQPNVAYANMQQNTQYPSYGTAYGQNGYRSYDQYGTNPTQNRQIGNQQAVYSAQYPGKCSQIFIRNPV